MKLFRLLLCTCIGLPLAPLFVKSLMRGCVAMPEALPLGVMPFSEFCCLRELSRDIFALLKLRSSPSGTYSYSFWVRSASSAIWFLLLLVTL